MNTNIPIMNSTAVTQYLYILTFLNNSSSTDNKKSNIYNVLNYYFKKSV